MLTTHGESSLNKRTELYTRWLDMKKRCYYKKHNRYNNYGGRGIKICKEWKNDYLEFKKWAIDNGYKKGLSLERINVNQNYKPSNCKWIPRSQQNLNTTKTVYINGKSIHIISKEYGIDAKLITNRIARGYPEDRLLEPRNTRKNKHLYITFTPSISFKNPWRAKIYYKGRSYIVGNFKTPEIAYKKMNKMKRKLKIPITPFLRKDYKRGKH